MDNDIQQFGPGFLPTFLYYFTGMLVITTLISAQVLHVSISTGTPIQLGVIVGLAGGLLGAVRNRTKVVTLPIKKRDGFAEQLEDTLTDLGYRKIDTPALPVDDTVTVYEPSSATKWFLAGRVYVQFSKKQVTIASRASVIKRIQAVLG